MIAGPFNFGNMKSTSRYPWDNRYSDEVKALLKQDESYQPPVFIRSEYKKPKAKTIDTKRN